MGDPTSPFLGVPKWPRAPRARFGPGHRSHRQAGRRQRSSHHRNSSAPQPQPQPQDALLRHQMPGDEQEEDALYHSGPLKTLNMDIPKRYGVTHPSRYGERDRMAEWNQTMLQNSLRADREMRDRLRTLHFPPLDMLQPRRRPHQARSLPAQIDGCAQDTGALSPRSLERRNVILPRTIRSNMLVDARGRRLFCELPLTDTPKARLAATNAP